MNSDTTSPPIQTTPYVIIFEGRNGSSHLVSLLNEHPDVICYPEIMPSLDSAAQNASIAAASLGAEVNLICGDASDEIYYPHGFARKWQARPFRATGFKTKVTDLKNIVAAIEELERTGYRLIYLRRRNLLKAVLSLINGRRLAEKHQQWNARAAAEVQGQVKIDMHDFRIQLRHRRVVETLHGWFFDTFRGPKIAIYYEDMMNDQNALLGRVLDFLDVPKGHLTLAGTFLKNTPDSLRAAVSNYSDLEHEYRDTEFARYLD